MPSQEGSDPRPLWRFRPASNEQKVTYEELSTKKDVINDERSWNVYENKQNYDKMPDTKADISTQLKPFLQNISGLEGRFGLNPDFSAVFLLNFAARQNRNLTFCGWRSDPSPVRQLT